MFVDKHPMHSLKLPLIARLFPNAKILFAYRDPRDVVLSCFRRRFNMNPAMYQLLTLEGAAAFYDATMRLADQAQPLLGLAWKSVHYESLIADFEPQLRAICDFIGLDWVANLGDFAARAQARERATPSTAQLAPRPRQFGRRPLAALPVRAGAGPGDAATLGAAPRLRQIARKNYFRRRTW